jgi:hypothetical protein
MVFGTPEEAAAAVAGMDGKKIAGQAVYVALSHHNNQRPRYGYGKGLSHGQGYGMLYAAPGMFYGNVPYQPYMDQYAQPQPWQQYNATALPYARMLQPC